MKKRRGQVVRGGSRKSRIQTVPFLERCEDRLLLANFTVTNTADVITATTNDGSLRGAILASNAATTASQILFNLPAGVQTISLAAALPAITQPVLIDGTTATGFDPANPQPLIEITGNGTLNAAGLTVSVAQVEIRDLIIGNFNGSGIVLNGGNDTVDGCYIGVAPGGTTLAKNTGTGIIVASPNNIIGATTTNPNVISGDNAGIQITGATATKNVIIHNFIGTNAAGTAKLGNTFDAIDVNTANNTIGAVSASGPLGGGNLISGNFAGISIANPGANNNTIEGNYIGSDVTGKLPIPNTFDGIDLQAVQGTTVGGTVAGAGNVISGNGNYGVLILGSTATGNRLMGNMIGVGSDQLTALGNSFTGILVNGAPFNQIGDTSFAGNLPVHGNIIAYNGKSASSNGVEILGAANDGILSNSIYNNGGLGIFLSGANGGVKAPTLTSVESGAAETRIMGTYFGNPSTKYRIQFFSNQTADPSGFGQGQNYLGDLDITTDSIGNASFTTLLMQGVPVGYSVSSTATQGPLVVNNTSAFGQDIQAVQANVVDLAVTTATSPATPLLNQPYTYTLTVTNNGPSDSTGVVLRDTIPTPSTFQSASAGTFAAGVLTDNIGALAANSSVVVTIVVKPNSTSGTFTNTATVFGDELDSNLMNNTSVTTGTVSTNADLSVVLTPGASPSAVGSPITFTLVVGNNGPSTANGTVATVNLPSSFDNSSIVVVPDQGSYTIGADNTVTINTGILPASTSSTILITANPTVVGTVNVTASATSNTLDPNPANNTVTVPVVIANAADLGVAISATPDPVLIGQELLYSVVVNNNGPSDATQAVVFDQLPAGVTFVPADSTPGLSFANGAVTATIGTVPAGGMTTITIAVTPTVSGQITNTVTVGDPDTTNPVEIDPDLSNNMASTTTQVSPADVGVVVNNPTDPLFIGTQAVYQVVVTNGGPADATNVILTDTLGAGAKIVGVSTGSVSGGTLTANLGTLPSGSSTTVTITVDPTASGTLIDSASVKSDQLDPNPNNNTSSSSNLVSPVDLAVTATGSPSPILVGHQLTYVVKVKNNGPATATNVQFTDTLPAGVTSVSVASTQGSLVASSLTKLSGSLGSLASGATATITIIVTPSILGTATNTASVTSANFDTDGANNSASTGTSVINLPGSIQFGSSSSSVPENAGSVAVTLIRVNGTLGTVTAHYATSDYTAIAGVNYVATSGTVTFLQGQSTATIKIPVLDDRVINGSHIFFVSLSSPTGGGSIGSQAVTNVVVTNTDRDTTPPFVSSLVAIPNGSSVNGFIITFDEPMDPTRASFLGNYHVYLSGTSNNSQSAVALAAAMYNPANNSVTLVPTAPLPNNRFYHLVVNATYGPALTDLAGNLLTGSSGQGSNYDVYYGQGTNLTYDDSRNNVVNINLSGGGTLSIFRGANGDATVVDLMGIVPHKSKLSGSVKKLNKFGTGYTTIGVINGFGKFGDVNSTLTTPSFYVTSAPVTASKVSVPVHASTVSVPVHATALAKSGHGKKTPKGPLHRSR